MILKKKNAEIVICKDLKKCESFMDLLLGLILSSNPRNLLFQTRFGIHSLFLKEPVDIVILNSEYKIVKIKKDLKPNRAFFWNPKYDLVLELSSGTINKFKLKTGDLVVVK